MSVKIAPLGRGLAACLMLGSLLVASKALAEDTGRYNSTIQQALSEYSIGNWAEAIALFERAHELQPNARTLRGLALANFEYRRYVKALHFGREALASEARPLSRKQKEELEQVVARADGFVARFSVTTVPSDATLTVDGYPAVRAPDGSVLLDPGQHELTATTDDGLSARRTVNAESGRPGKLTITLADAARDELADKTFPAPAAEPPTTQDVEVKPEAEQESGSSIGPWVVMGAGGAVLIASAITGALTASAEQDLLDAGCDEMPCGSSQKDTLDRGKDLQLATNVLLGVGIATVAGGALWLILDSSGSDDEKDVAASATCTPGFCGGALNAKF
jgi:hypothetical protein